MRKVDLTPKPEPKDPLDAVYKANDAATESEPAKPALTPRVVLLRIRARNPETGDIEVIELESTAPDRGARLRMGRAAVQLADGVPLHSMLPGDLAYLTWLARIAVQCPPLPESKRWVTDDATNVAVIAEALVEHDQRYFCGNVEADGSGPFTPVVERPWPRADAAVSGAGG